MYMNTTDQLEYKIAKNRYKHFIKTGEETPMEFVSDHYKVLKYTSKYNQLIGGGALSKLVASAAKKAASSAKKAAQKAAKKAADDASKAAIKAAIKAAEDAQARIEKKGLKIAQGVKKTAATKLKNTVALV